MFLCTYMSYLLWIVCNTEQVLFVLTVHFCAYKEKFINLYCRLSSVLDLDALITQQALREAITDAELTIAKQRHQHILDYIQVHTEHPSISQHRYD